MFTRIYVSTLQWTEGLIIEKTKNLTVTYSVQQPTDDLFVAFICSMLERSHTMFVQYIRAQVMFGIDLLEAIKVVDKYRFENVLRHPVAVLRINHDQKQERVINSSPRPLKKSPGDDFGLVIYVTDGKCRLHPRRKMNTPTKYCSRKV